MRKRIILFMGGVSLLACTSPANAQSGITEPEKADDNSLQSADSAQDENPASEENASNIIVVTANKRQQNLADVGLSISVQTREELQAERIFSGADLATVTPGLVFAPTASSTPVYTLRGVGFYEASLAAYPDVSLYIDQAPLPLPVMATLTAFDLERVEVLKGPQGTLFGNNATGGAINFIAAKPTHQLEAGIELGYGRFNTFDISGFVSGPIAENLRGRIAIRAENGDGWQISSTRDDRLGKTDNIAGRVILDWDPADFLRFSLNVNGWRNQNDPQAWQVSGLDIKSPAGAAGAYGVVPDDYPVLTQPVTPRGHVRLADWSPSTRPFTDDTFWQTSLRTDIDVSDSILITSITSYEEFRLDGQQDQDGSDLILFAYPNHRGYINSFSQELRLSNNDASRFRWVIGANYEHTNTGEYFDVLSTDATTTPTNGAALVRDDNFQRMRNYAVFANGEFDITDVFTLKGGIRQSKAKRRSNAAGYTLPGVPAPEGVPLTYTEFFNFVYDLLYPGQIPLINEGESYVLDTRVNPDGSPVDPETFFKTGRYFGRLSEDSTSWSVGVDVHAADNMLFYFNVSQGYKSGSFPLLAAAIFTGLEPVTQESLLDYEGGFKISTADQSVSVTGAAFYYDYSDKQLLTKFVDPIFGELDRLQNVPKSKVEGAELTVTIRPLDGLSLSGDVTYLNAKVKEYIGPVGSQTVGGLREPILASFAGVRLPFSPKWQYSFGADYETDITDELTVYFGVNVHGQSQSLSTLAATAQARDDSLLQSYALVDGRFGIKTADGRWRLGIWGKNIFNKFYEINRFVPYDTKVRLTGEPATYGVSLSFTY